MADNSPQRQGIDAAAAIDRFTSAERAELTRCEAVIENFVTAPPRGQGVTLDAPPQIALPETFCKGRRQDTNESPAQAIAAAMFLHAGVGDVIDTLCLSPKHDDRRIVGAIRNLWAAIPGGRFEVKTWGEDIAHVRRFRSFRCVVGHFASVVEAVQELAETVLETLWRVGQKADPPPGPPYAVADLPFELHGALPSFRVDWWYSVLPAIRRDCADLGKRFGVGAVYPGRWDAALKQELAAIRRRGKRQLPARTREQPVGPIAPTHSADFTSVNWFGAGYQFAKGLQAESVRVLWEAWETGAPGLSEQTIGEKAGSSNDRFRLEHVFKPTNKSTGRRQAHPAWGSMIKSVGKGVFALSPP